MAVSALQMSVNLKEMAKNIRPSIQRTLFSEGSLIKKDLQSRSPVDTGRYRSRWIISRNRFSSGNVFSSITISNPSMYAYWMEAGGVEGGEPWYYPNPKRKRSGKLIRRNGRVWAGGINPGHSMTVGGAIGPAIADNEKRKDRLANTIANSIIRTLK